MVTESVAPEQVPESWAEWVIESSCRTSGLDPNAVVRVLDTPDEGEGGPARLTYPSPFCPLPRPWLAVLARLTEDGLPPFQLYLCIGDGCGLAGLVSMARLHPRIDRATLRLLRQVAAEQADELEDLSDRVEQAFRLLRGPPLPAGTTGETRAG